LETSLSSQLITLVLTTRNKEIKYCIQHKHKREKEKNCPSLQNNLHLIWYAFYDLRPGNRAGPILTALEPTQDKVLGDYAILIKK